MIREYAIAPLVAAVLGVLWAVSAAMVGAPLWVIALGGLVLGVLTGRYFAVLDRARRRKS